MPETGFKDHFSAHADAYARYRPDYPPALFAWLAEIAPARGRAWDCATGSGQAAVALAEHFAEVVATDASEKQVRSAFQHPRITYRSPPPRLGIGARRWTDHGRAGGPWFDIPAFYREAARADAGGVLACGRTPSSPPRRIDRVVDRCNRDAWPLWPPDRGIIERGTRRVLPFEPVAAGRRDGEAWLAVLDRLSRHRRHSRLHRAHSQTPSPPSATSSCAPGATGR